MENFENKQADDMAFPAEIDNTVVIGGRTIRVRPLNLFGTQTILRLVRKLIEPLRSGFLDNRRASDKFILDEGPKPDEFWYFPIIEDDMNEVLKAVLVVLKRDDESLSLAFLEEHLEPFVHLPRIFGLVASQNHLETLLKKAIATELGKMGVKMLASRLPSGSPVSPSTSRSTTVTDTTKSSAPEATSPSPEPSFSETESAEILV